MDTTSIPANSAPARGLRWAIETERIGPTGESFLDSLSGSELASFIEELEAAGATMGDVPKVVNGRRSIEFIRSGRRAGQGPPDPRDEEMPNFSGEEAPLREEPLPVSLNLSRSEEGS